MTTPIIALNVNSRQYSKLITLGNAVAASLTGNANFTSPAVTIVNLQAAVTDVVNAQAVWGPPNNRGSRAAHVDLQNKAVTLYNLLKAEANYVEATAAIAAGDDKSEMAAIIITSGFGLKSSKHHQGDLGKVQNLRFMDSISLNQNQVKMVWERPLEVTSPLNVKSYNVYRSVSTSFAAAVQIAPVSKAEFIDTNNTGSTVTWTYFVCALGAAGEGAVSDPITVTLLPA